MTARPGAAAADLFPAGPDDGEAEAPAPIEPGVNDVSRGQRTIAIAAQIDIEAEIELTAKLIASRSLGAFLAMRALQATRHGHTPEADLERRPLDLARAAYDRVRDARELLDGRDPNRGRLERALKKVEAAGGVLLALHDRLAVAIAAAPEGEEA